MSQAARQFSVSTVELVYLAGLLGADGLLGVEDPFAGQVAAEVEEGLIRARSSLAYRGLLTLSQDGTVAISEALAALVKACAQPAASVLLTCTGAGQPRRVCCFHRSGETAVELSVGPDRDSVCVITDLGEPDEVTVRACLMLGLREQASPPGGPVTLSEDDLRVASRTAAETGSEAAESFLTGKGLPAATALPLAEALAKPVSNGSAVAMCRRDPEWEIAGFGLLHGPEGFWLLKPARAGAAAAVDVVPATGQQVQAEVGRLTAGVREIAISAMRGEHAT